MRTESINIYKFDELPDSAKENARQWWREGHEYFDFDECLESLNEFLGLFGPVSVTDYSVGPYCHSYVTLSVKRHDTSFGYADTEDDCLGLSGVRLWKWIINNTDLQQIINSGHGLTGYWSDWPMLQIVQDFLKSPHNVTMAELLDDCAEAWLSQVVADMEWQLEDEQVDENIRANGYEFDESGDFHF